MRYGAQPLQQRTPGNSPRERKRRQAAASRVATPRRELQKQGVRIQQPGFMSPAGWKREKWIARGQGEASSEGEETD